LIFFTAAQLFFHRYRLTSRIDRAPDLARRDARVMHQVFGQHGQRAQLRRNVKARGDGVGAAERAAPQGPMADGAVHVDENLRHHLARHRRRMVEPL